MDGMAEWAVQTMGIFQGEVQKRMTEHRCIADLRKSGVIR